MLTNFFQFGPIPTDAMIGHYTPSLVLLSYLVAVFASYIALDFTGRLRDASNTRTSSLFWLIGGSLAMGAGIWSMHFIGMLSFTIPDMAMHYNLLITSLSLLVAILASGFALYLLSSKVISIFHFAIGGIILGLAIASMHYTGMAAMTDDMVIHYIPSIFILSIIIAISASEIALFLAIKSNQVISKFRIRLKIVSAAIMGAGICGMHYVGMAAAVFTMNPHPTLIHSIDLSVLTVSIAGVTFIILGIAFFASTYKEALNQQQLETARQLGMAEVSVSVLHNVGNVLNSVTTSAELIGEKIAASKLSELSSLYTLLSEHKDDLAVFLTQDPRGMKIPEFINLLANYWDNEKKYLTTEVTLLQKNIQHIKEIISTQQGISKIKGIEQVIDINSAIDEALLIAGLDLNQNEFLIEKHFEKMKPVLTDQVKLLQILVNLFKNAKDSLANSTNKNKFISITSAIIENKRILIKIADNGGGISSENINKIFTYGFTTKKTGHGYGLHASALAINEMGGSIKAESDGLEKGAIFILEIPNRIPKK